MRKIVISGWYGCGNLGDEAILLSTLDILRTRYPEASFVVISEDPDRIRRDYGDYPLRAVPQRSYYYPMELLRGVASGAMLQVFSAIRGADLFLLGGGGLLRDNTSRRNLVRIVDECALARALGVPVALFAIGVGPIDTKWGARLIRRVAGWAGVITVRDPASADLLRSLGVSEGRIHVTADPAFLLEAEAPMEPWLREERLLGVFPCEGLFWGERAAAPVRERILADLARLCDRLAENPGLTPVFVPFRTGAAGDDDLVVCDQILERMAASSRAIRIPEPPAPKQVRGWMDRFRYVIGSRLHSVILAAAAGTPCIGINYEPKVGHFVRSVSPHARLAELPDIEVSRCESFVRSSESGYEERRAAFRAAASERARAALRTFDLVSEAVAVGSKR